MFHRMPSLSLRVFTALVSLAILSSGCDNGPPLNHAAALTWRGAVDTDLQFSEFFDSNHTVMARFMLQHPLGYVGAILANNGSGTYFIGQGNYRGESPIGDRGAKLMIRIGDARGCYTRDDTLTDGKWHHVAVVRNNSSLRLYLDGEDICPDAFSGELFCAGDLTLPTTGLPGPNSTLRMGRPTDGVLLEYSGSNRETQFYGLVDDVAIFNHALTKQEIQGIIAADRLTGQESGLVAGYAFDSTTPSGDPLPSVLSRPVTFQNLTGASGLEPAFKTLVSQARESELDATFLPRPVQKVARRLPLLPGQEWEVSQGFGQTVSHNDFAQFSWDFILVGANTESESSPDTSCGQPVFASASGTVVANEWLDGGGGSCAGCADCKDGRNFVRMHEAPGQRGSYLHLQTGSITQAFDNAGLFFPPFGIGAGDPIGAVGTRCDDACHLHAAVGGEASAAVTIPTAYSNYEYSNDGGQTWHFAEQGVPETGQWVRALP